MLGMFDSGFGGLTILRAVRDLLPTHDILYLGDTARTPYGNRSRETVTKYTKECCEIDGKPPFALSSDRSRESR